jgi:hypothetical protein
MKYLERVMERSLMSLMFLTEEREREEGEEQGGREERLSSNRWRV